MRSHLWCALHWCQQAGSEHAFARDACKLGSFVLKHLPSRWIELYRFCMIMHMLLNIYTDPISSENSSGFINKLCMPIEPGYTKPIFVLHPFLICLPIHRCYS
jgi:hypothetical protein